MACGDFPQAALFYCCLFVVFHNGQTGDAAVGQAVGNGIAAQTVGAMQAAGYFAGSVQAGDPGAVLAQHVGVNIHAHAAHGVVHGGAAGQA